MKTPESYEKAEIDKFLKEIGAYIVKPATYGYGASGTPDRVCCIHGRFWGLEIKREGKGPTKLQELRMKEIVNAGGQAAWGTASKVIPEIQAWLHRRVHGGTIF